MQLRYIVNNIGIYIEYTDKKWNDSVEKELRNQNICYRIFQKLLSF